jgi:hypothetical protein
VNEKRIWTGEAVLTRTTVTVVRVRGDNFGAHSAMTTSHQRGHSCAFDNLADCARYERDHGAQPFWVRALFFVQREVDDGSQKSFSCTSKLYALFRPTSVLVFEPVHRASFQKRNSARHNRTRDCTELDWRVQEMTVQIPSIDTQTKSRSLIQMGRWVPVSFHTLFSWSRRSESNQTADHDNCDRLQQVYSLFQCCVVG